MKTNVVFAAWLLVLCFTLGGTPLFAQDALEPMDVTSAFIPSGYLGDGGAMSLGQLDGTRPDSFCTKIIYTPRSDGWGGVYWQYPDNNWCKKRGLVLSGYTKLTFWVRGETGRERVKFKVGHDCAGESFALNPPKDQHLTTSWQQVTINLSGKDLSNITGGFAWIVDSHANAGKTITFYLDDIQFE